MIFRLRPIAIACALAATFLIAGCGGGSSSSSDDPASVVPAGAPVYIQATLQPSGSLKSNTDAAISTITGESDPGKAIVGLIDKKLASQAGNLTYANDIKPWLGANAGLFVDSFSENNNAAVILQSTNDGAAQDFIDSSSKINNGGGVKDASYNGVDYKLEDDGDASGLIEGFVVTGDEKAFKQAVDASKGDTLADDSDFKDTIDGAPSNSLADVYVSVGAFARAVQQQVESQNAAFAANLFGNSEGKTALGSLIPAGDRIELDFSTDAGGSSGSGDASQLLAGFPAGAFAAIAVPNLGDRVKKAVSQLENSGIPGLTPGAIAGQLQARGIDYDKLTSSLGDLGAFVEGSDQKSFAGAVVITTSDPSAAKGLVSNLGSLLQLTGTTGVSSVPGGFQIKNARIGPQPLIVKTVGGRIVAGYGTKATAEAASGGGKTLGDTQLYKQGVDALGAGVNPSAYLDFAHLLSISQASDHGSDPQFRMAKPYLDHVTYLVLGSGESGSKAVSTLIAGLQK